MVALAVGFHTVWTYLACRPPSGGWYSYAPLSRNTYPGTSGSGVAPALAAIALIVAWAFASIWLLGLPHPDSGDQAESN